MPPTLLRQLWALIETSHATSLLSLDDASLVQWLLHEVDDRQALDPEQTQVVSHYIRSRLPLIRDVAGENAIVR